MIDAEARAAAARVLDLCRGLGLKVALAESCTGGLLAATLTAIPGSSDVIDRGFVSYSYASKTELLGVPADLIGRVGAVSEEVARAMAEGALARSPADLAVAVTGVAGPGSDSQAKPAGLVHLAGLRRSGAWSHDVLRLGDAGRDAVRARSVTAALALIEGLVSFEAETRGGRSR
ncbi:MAG: CinA family protein [Alphaproteobacteria bacterium]|nr:CinA family protein [Alphaproteobacteria bacterium]